MPLSERVYFGDDAHLASNLNERVLEAASLLGSAGVRYAAPAGMITAAGAGLADLTQNLYESMSEQPVLPTT